MRSGLAAHRAGVRRQQFARALHARKVACAYCSAYFLTEDEAKTTCSTYCQTRVEQEAAAAPAGTPIRVLLIRGDDLKVAFPCCDREAWASRSSVRAMSMCPYCEMPLSCPRYFTVS